ncbi:MAG: M20/M25/M40 family metallo-hydrolase [Acidobacteriota bacterium]
MTNVPVPALHPTPFLLGELLDEAWAGLKSELVATLQELVRIPSENLPPAGNERACQAYVATCLRRLALEPDVYEIADVRGLSSHPEYWPGRHYVGRPNVNAVLRGSGGGRSLILSGHIDTVPADTPVEWRYPPFGGEAHNGRIYGRGAWDMKAGVAMHLTVLRTIAALGWKLKGDLIFETVVDEEFGGVNGTLAARLRGYNAEAAIIGEPTSLRVCPAQRGGRIIHILFQGQGGISPSVRSSGRAVEQMSHVLAQLPEFAARRGQRVAIDPYYSNCPEPFAVWVTNIATGRWGWTQPITIPERCRLEIYWQTMPGETCEEVESEFFDWWNEMVANRPDLFSERPVVELPMRWLPGCSIPPDSPLVTGFAQAAGSLGVEARVEGMDAPSDMYIFQRCFNTPALMWGPSGGNAHQADEFVEIDSLFQAIRVLLHFVCRWCEVEVATGR